MEKLDHWWQKVIYVIGWIQVIGFALWLMFMFLMMFVAAISVATY